MARADKHAIQAWPMPSATQVNDTGTRVIDMGAYVIDMGTHVHDMSMHVNGMALHSTGKPTQAKTRTQSKPSLCQLGGDYGQ